MNTNIISTAGRLSALLLLCAMTGCCPAGKVQVNPASTTAPDLFWEVTKESPDAGPGLGTAISREILVDEEAKIVIPSDYTFSVVLKGKDSQTGIKTLKAKGRFGFTCKNAAGAEYVGDGFVPEQTEEFAADSNGCALIEAAHSTFSAAQPCKGEGRTLVESTYIFHGEATNQAGAVKSKSLVVSFAP